uniref:Secreted protein n=1 Tax=Thraustotheca clavata TaxID=74557 RepID=A0A0A7CM49_9STRA|nr:secreted protein [Thraustotheca clavata]
MKQCILVNIILAAATSALNSTDSDRESLLQELNAWRKSKAGVHAAAKGYRIPHFESADANQLDAELDAFAETKRTVAELNKKYPLATFSTNNPFSAMTNEQFANWIKASQPPSDGTTKNITEFALLESTSTDTVDWSTSGCVAPVKNQGICGSCYAYAAVGAVESAYCLVNNRKFTLFSEQNLLSCGPGGGCSGGFPDVGLNWISAHGLCTSESYPNTNEWSTEAHTCEKSCTPVKMPFTNLGSAVGEYELEQTLKTQPVAVQISASSPVFKNYQSGIITSGCDTGFDHAVLGVGYGTAEVPYFKMKNSWGQWWGEQGYVRLQRGVGGLGTCGLARRADYPIISKTQFNLVNINKIVISEYYSNLYADTARGSVNEQWSYDTNTHQLIVNSNHECLDAYLDNGTYHVHTYKCDASNANQLWTIDSTNHRIKHRSYSNLCLDVDPNQNNKVQVWQCYENSPNQWIAVSEERVKLWSFNDRFLSSNGEIIQFSSAGSFLFEWVVNNIDHTWRARSNTGNPDLCLDAYEPWNGGSVHLWSCDSNNANQKWLYDPSTQQLRHMTHKGFCLDMRSEDGSKAHLWTCNSPVNNLQKFRYVSITYPM